MKEALPPITPMQQALALARSAFGLTEPNPRVGCVIVDASGRELGSGHTQAAGDAHAEVMALRAAAAAGADVKGATAYVTLEPCSHHGRTPPCCDALISAGIGRVVVAVGDPNPLVAGRGLARLREAGIDVVMDDADTAQAATALNIGFFARMQRGRPWVRLKVAASLDGHTALDNGVSQWITGPAARADGHAWRRRASVVLTGVGTVREDNPRLDVRLVDTPRQPRRVIVDSRLETPADARVLEAPGEVLIYAASAPPDAAAALQARGAKLVLKPGLGGKVDLAAMLADLAERGVNEVHVEAGFKLNGSLVKAGLVDEYLVYLAPLLTGGGRGMAGFGPLASLADGVALDFVSVESVGADLRIVARPKS